VRRFIGLKIDELEELARDNEGDSVVLAAILDELKHRRSTDRVRALVNVCVHATSTRDVDVQASPETNR
jgi:hypothetical protein